jgi:deoxyribodipyrimidine photo-lyase
MPGRALVWFRRDLRVHDNPALTAAHRAHEEIVPVFVLDRRLILGEYPSGPRTHFLLESLEELRTALRERGGELVVREGRPEEELPRLAAETGATAVHLASDVSPFARGRDTRTARALEQAGVALHPHPGTFVADSVDGPRTADGRPFTVFSPFHRRHAELPRRDVLGAPRALRVPAGLAPGTIPAVDHFGLEAELTDPMPPGEAAARARATHFLSRELEHYADRHDRLAGGTSELSPAIHFGCISVRELEARALQEGGDGARAFVRQLAWRDFYAHVLLHHPGNAHEPFQSRMQALETREDQAAFDAWREGRTGVPIVDAAMRQLRTRGWMHNRARLVVGSFLTKNLHLDYRLGEAHFMRYLLCGDKAQNNGNWQWIASVGVDPAPAFQRMFNPVRQQQRFDPDGEYVRRWVPELARVEDRYLAEPWTMTEIDQGLAGCVIGEDYPAPIVDHKREREVALQRYRDVPKG